MLSKTESTLTIVAVNTRMHANTLIVRRGIAVEVVLGVGTCTMSTLANRMTQAPLDEQLSPFAWDG